MIWTDEKNGRRWIVRQLGRISGEFRAVEKDDQPPRETMPVGSVVVAFISMDPPSESRVVAGVQADWSERPESLPELFAKASTGRRD
jgi:hypothetical protein